MRASTNRWGRCSVDRDVAWPDHGSSGSRQGSGAGRTTVLVADDHAGFRHALESLIRSAADLELLGSARDGEEVVRLTSELRPQVVVMDLGMPGLNGVEATRRVRGRHPAPVVVALSGSHELIREATAAGAAVTMLKDVDPVRLLEAIRAAGGP
jgi:DNA-binding NarL/FixJ family response regulator